MRSKVFYGIAVGAFVLATELLFFWLIPFKSLNFTITYPFYAFLSIGHVALLFYIVCKYKHPASFAPALVGSILALLELVGIILAGVFLESVRTILFLEGIGLFAYIFTMTLLIGFAVKDSAEEPVSREPVRPYPPDNAAPITGAYRAPAARRRPPKMLDE